MGWSIMWAIPSWRNFWTTPSIAWIGKTRRPPLSDGQGCLAVPLSSCCWMTAEDWRSPVNWADIHSVEELLVYERAVVQPDPDTYRTGKATYFDVSSTYGGFFRVHRSRCLVFKNGSLPEFGAPQQYFYWGLPEYIRIKRDLSIVLKTHQNAANMIEKSVQPVYKQKNLQSTLATEGGDTAVLKRLNVIDQARGMLNSIAVDMDGEDYTFQTFQLSGTQEILESTYNLLSAVTCIPQTILFGRSPSGENATGESDLENYYNFVEGIQKRMLKKNIRTLLKAVTQAGVYDGSIEDPGTIKPTFKPLWSLSEAEQATVDSPRPSGAATAQTRSCTSICRCCSLMRYGGRSPRAGSLNIEDILDNQPEDEQDDGWAALLEGLGEEENLQNFNTQTPVESSIIKGQGNSDRMDSFKESDHPRDKNGKFTGGASSGSGTPPKSSNGLTDAEKRKISERFVGTKTHDGVEIKSFRPMLLSRVGGRKFPQAKN